MTPDPTKRWALAAGAAGLVGGLALGATGLASAVAPSQAPDAEHNQVQPGPRHLPPGMKGLVKAHRGAGGLVTQISASSLTVRTPRGTRTIGLTASTVFFEGRAKATRSAVEVGELVRVVLVDRKATSPVASRVVVMPARLGGWVTGVDGSRVTLVDHAGFTRVFTTSDRTTVTKNGAAVTPAAITVGSFVHAVGSVADDGTTLEAARVQLGAKAKREGRAARAGFGSDDVLPSV